MSTCTKAIKVCYDTRANQEPVNILLVDTDTEKHTMALQL